MPPPQQLRDVRTIHAGHREVEDHGFGVEASKATSVTSPSFRMDRPVAEGLQSDRKRSAHVQLVINDTNDALPSPHHLPRGDKEIPFSQQKVERAKPGYQDFYPTVLHTTDDYR